MATNVVVVEWFFILNEKLLIKWLASAICSLIFVGKMCVVFLFHVQ